MTEESRAAAPVLSSDLQPNTINFTVAGGTEILRLAPDGFYVRGVKVDDEAQVYEGFRLWLEEANREQLALRSEPAPVNRNAVLEEAAKHLELAASMMHEPMDRIEEFGRDCLLESANGLRFLKGNAAPQGLVNAVETTASRVAPAESASRCVVGASIPDEFSTLAKFYNVDSMAALVRIQSEHVERLQKKLPPIRDQFPRTPREG